MTQQKTFRTPRPTAKPGLRILLVEDDEIDILAIQRALKKLKLPHQMLLAEDGLEAIELLEQSDPSTFPHLLITDLNMPRMNGLELLQQIRQRADWNELPILVWTTSHFPPDRQTAESFGILGYIVKSAQGSPLNDLRQMLEIYSHFSATNTPSLALEPSSSTP